MLLVLLMFLQNFRRLVECLTVSVYSKGTMNIAHYFLGIALYSTFNIAVISEAPTLLIRKRKFVFSVNLFTFTSEVCSEPALYWHSLACSEKTRCRKVADDS